MEAGLELDPVGNERIFEYFSADENEKYNEEYIHLNISALHEERACSSFRFVGCLRSWS